MICFPNAKINLGLNIIEKRNDGFHNIETIFYPVQWCDALEVITSELEDESSMPEKKVIFSVSGIKINDNWENNLCVKTYQLLEKDFRLPAIKMHLHKIIPAGAGLGGGSSDAAFMLKMLNRFFNLNQSDDALKKYAQQLGSDCSFFIDNVPSFAYSRGEKTEVINVSLKGYVILIVKPNVHITTSEAYQAVTPQTPVHSLKEIIILPVDEWKNSLKNDFEKIIFKKFPVIEGIKNKMYGQGSVYASMSGSGSAVYGIFKEKCFNKNSFKDSTIWEGVLA